jgi:hypothetical protein
MERRSAASGPGALARQKGVEASTRRLKSLERYSTALLNSDHDNTANEPKQRNPRRSRDSSREVSDGT